MTDLGDLPRELPASRGFCIVYRGKTLLSRIDPVGQAERIARSITARERTLYVCPSPLYGYGLSVLLENLKSNSAILCIEADPLLFDLSQKSMKSLIETAKGRIALVQAETGPYAGAAICDQAAKIWGQRSFRRTEQVHLTGGWQLFPEIYEKLTAVLQKDIASSWGNAMTLIKLGRLYMKNAVRNLALLPAANSIAALNYGSRPVLVLGAGPGMDIMLDEIAGRLRACDDANQQARPFRIICADTCLPSLRERGIKPDLAVVLESQHWNLRDFLNVKGWKIAAAFDLSALPSSTRVLDGEIYFFMTPWTELHIFERLKQAGLLPPALAPLGSVGLTAAGIAGHISRGPVITAGLDFSFTIDAYHARSSPGHLARLAAANRFKTLLNAETAFRDGTFAVKSKSGNPVRSDPALRNYRNLFEEEFSSSNRFYEISGPGLSLGLKILDPGKAADMLMQPGAQPGFDADAAEQNAVKKQTDKSAIKNATVEFIGNEKNYLLKLRGILTGQIQAGPAELEGLLDTCDYLWAHFPECAAAGGRRPAGSDIGFLKRVRMEIEPFLNLWDRLFRD
ncbi:MAG: DUF115 domain-containing protein [Treponema sp.]|nr:DUF115 domain-containing protein [Treponema sp.]